MQSVKIDQFLKAGIVLLSGVLVIVLYTSIHEHIVDVGDSAPDFTITADNGRTNEPLKDGTPRSSAIGTVISRSSSGAAARTSGRTSRGPARAWLPSSGTGN